MALMRLALLCVALLPVASAEQFAFQAVNEDYTSNRVFNALHGLFKGWHQAHAPNPRSVVPVVIPAGTLLYNANAGSVPLAEVELEWLAFDPAHAYQFGRGANATLWTFVVTKPLRALAFDGFSAAKTANGTLDLQQVLAFGKVIEGEPMPPRRTGQPPPTKRPYPTRPPGHGGGPPGAPDEKVGHALCERFRKKGIKGFVRLEATFEIMACSLQVAEFRLVSAVNISRQMASPRDEDRPVSDVFWRAQQWSFYRASATHHHVAERRVIPAAAHLVSLYDETAYPSLADNNGQSVYQHRLKDMSSSDVERWRKEIDQSIDDWNKGVSSGADWGSIAQTAHDSYFSHLAELRAVLARSSNDTCSVIEATRRLSFSMLLPYINAPHTLTIWPEPPSANAREAAIERAAQHCSLAMTAHLPRSLTRQEERLKKAIEGVSKRVCLFAGSLLSQSLVLLDEMPAMSEPDAIKTWRRETEELVEWLAWPDFNRCERLCTSDEACVIDLWPLEGRAGTDHGRPLPRCMSFEEFTSL